MWVCHVCTCHFEDGLIMGENCETKTMSYLYRVIRVLYPEMYVFYLKVQCNLPFF